MPLYDWQCDCGHIESTWAEIDLRDVVKPQHRCGKPMRRLPGGRGLLYFEEGRARVDQGLGGKPITSPGERAKRMRQAGVTEAPDYFPEQMRKKPKSLAMRRRMEKDQKGRWI